MILTTPTLITMRINQIASFVRLSRAEPAVVNAAAKLVRWLILSPYSRCSPSPLQSFKPRPSSTLTDNNSGSSPRADRSGLSIVGLGTVRLAIVAHFSMSCATAPCRHGDCPVPSLEFHSTGTASTPREVSHHRE